MSGWFILPFFFFFFFFSSSFLLPFFFIFLLLFFFFFLHFFLGAAPERVPSPQQTRPCARAMAQASRPPLWDDVEVRVAANPWSLQIQGSLNFPFRWF